MPSRLAVTVAVLLLAAIVGGIDSFLKTHTPTFDHLEIAHIARNARRISFPQQPTRVPTHEEMFANITAELRRRYPGYIVDEPEWLFINAGAALFCRSSVSSRSLFCLF